MSRSFQEEPNYKLKRSSSLECTCELNQVKAVSKHSLRYSMCDICSERLFSKNEISAQINNNQQVQIGQ